MSFLPHRMRGYLDRAALWSMRLRPSMHALQVSGGEPIASLLAAGDIVLSRGVYHAIRDHGPASIFAPLKPILDGCDLRVANLESPLTRREAQPGILGGVLKAPPESVEALTAARFDAVTVANNHCMDFGPEGLLECLHTLDAHGIRHCGAGDSPLAARRPAILETKGIRVGMLGYADDYRPASPLDSAAGPAPSRDDEILQDLRAIRANVDIVVLQLHWGVEFAMYPWLTHRTRARRYAEAGANLVVCHHAHVPMGLETWKGSVIAYGLGNVIFPASRHLVSGHPWSYRSVILKASFHRTGISHAQIIPVEMRRDFSVAPSTGGKRAEMLGAVRKASKGLLDSDRLERIEGDQLTRETLGWLDVIDPPDGLGKERLRDLAAVLTAPRQQGVIEWLLRQPFSSAYAVGCFLAEVSRLAQAPEAELESWWERRDAFRPRMREFAFEFRVSRDRPGKLP